VFSLKKLEESLKRSGAGKKLVDQVVSQIRKKIKPGISTSEIYRLAFQSLKSAGKPYASRYSLKRAIMKLGPDGFPFEEYLAALLREHGYIAYTNQIFRGSCLTHEIDVVAEIPSENIHAIIEAKFHSRPGRKTGSKDALYTHARFLDINNAWSQKVKSGAKPKDAKLQNWLVTNTKVTTEVKKYARCIGMTVIGWDYPSGRSLQDLIENKGLYPITVLISLNGFQKKNLLRQDIVLCKDILENKIAKRILDKNFNKIKNEVEILLNEQ